MVSPHGTTYNLKEVKLTLIMSNLCY